MLIFYVIVQKEGRMEILLKNICEYLDYLTAEKYRYVTLHGDFVSMLELFRYNIHLNPYCLYVKTVCESRDVCVKNQKKVLERCREGAFFGVCHAGVGEYVYPISVCGRISGFVSVSGFKGRYEETATEKALHFADRKKLPHAWVSRMRDECLSPVIPNKNEVDTLIYPLIFMLESYLEKHGGATPQNTEDDLYVRMLNYIASNYDTHITMEKLGEQLNYSVSTLSHLFKARSGVSIRDYIQKLRLDEAKLLLRRSGLSLTEISDSLGFCNSAYFSAVFKRNVGMSPLEYRKHAD
jgi:AraC-like DNA-binding protein/ligand-binding sensor protein